jgi:methylated-DNA-[protein]-cysteine S-methyltransferase
VTLRKPLAETPYNPAVEGATISSPIGRLELISNGSALTRILFHAKSDPTPGAFPDVLERARRQLQQYFAGERTAFDLPLAPHGTPFQRAVWEALVGIPYGETTSYGDLAARIDRPTAVRAVGAANGQNPIPIVIPCHRVIGRNGSLVGFGGGLETKKRLLDLEQGRAALLFDDGRP